MTRLAACPLRDRAPQAERRTTFEVFVQRRERLPDGRRYGVVPGTGRYWKPLPHSSSMTEA